MGSFSRDTFDKLKHYVGVRLQQGVPLIDADWNEQEDIRKYELQAFLKWFVGNGVPKGNDGFRIEAIPAENDFWIKGGDGTPDGAGRCLVEGWDVINESNLKYTAQPLFNNAALAAKWGVDPVQPLTTPTTDRTDMVYLDVWEREVDAEEDENLVNPAIGIETCVRLKQEWCVRVDEGIKGYNKKEKHHYYDLANITWEDQAISDVKDLRTKQLTLGSVKDKLKSATQATVNTWIEGGECEIGYETSVPDEYEFKLYDMNCIIAGKQIEFVEAESKIQIKEGENCVVLANAIAENNIEFVVTRNDLLEWLNNWSLEKWTSVEVTDYTKPVLKSTFTLPLYFFERLIGPAEFQKTDLRHPGVLDTWLAQLAGRLDARERRMYRVPLLQQTIFGRAVPAATIEVGFFPWDLVFDGTHMWVANYASRNVSKIDIITNTVVATTVSLEGRLMGIAFDGIHIWVANSESNNISKIDVITNTVAATVSVQDQPWGIAFDGTHIWVANWESSSVSKIDTIADMVVETVSVGVKPRGIAFDGTHMWVANYESRNVSKIDIITNTVVATVSVEAAPWGVAFDGTHMWVANTWSHNVSKIDIITNAVVATISVEDNPCGVAFDGTHIWVANSKSDSVSKIDISTNTVAPPVRVGDQPQGIAFDGTHIWVANYKSNSVSKIQTKGLK